MQNSKLELKLEIKEIELHPYKLWFKHENNEADHKFLVYRQENSLLLYLSDTDYHAAIAGRYNLKESNIIGGGDFYLEKEKGKTIFVLSGSSGKYKGIPREILNDFAELLLPELQKYPSLLERKINIQGYLIERNLDLNDFWKK